MELRIETDPDVLAVVTFMQENLTADRLVSVAEALTGLAPALWGHFERSEVRALSLTAAMVCLSEPTQ
jgi:hypothetical protein